MKRGKKYSLFNYFSFCVNLSFRKHNENQVNILNNSSEIYFWIVLKLQIVVLLPPVLLGWQGGRATFDDDGDANHTGNSLARAHTFWRSKAVAALPETLPSLLKAGAYMYRRTLSADIQ